MEATTLNTTFLNGCTKGLAKRDAGGGIGSMPELSLSYLDAKLWDSCSYYSSIEAAVEDISKNSVMSNCDELDAVVAIDKSRNYRLFLLKNITIDSEIILDGIDLILNGKKLYVETPIIVTSSATIDGRAKNSTIIGQGILKINTGTCKVYGGTYKMSTSKMGTNGSPFPCFNVSGGTLEMDGCILDAVDDSGGTISNVLVNVGASLIATNSYMKLVSKYGMQSCCIYNNGNITLDTCKLEAFSDHTANAAGNNYERTSRAIYSSAGSTSSISNCYAYGPHSGMTFQGNVSVDGGTYCGYSHGGIYLSNTNSTTKIKNATFKDVPLPSGYYDDGVAGTNGAAIYIGGTSGMNVYFDNCTFYAEIQTLVMKTGGNTMYVSNCRMRHGYSRCGIRNDSSNQVKFGINNNFDYTNLENKRNYEVTGLDYGE